MLLMQLSKKQIGVGTLEITEKERSYVLDVLANNRLSYGPYSKKFECTFAALHDMKYGIFVNSGTSALSIAIACLKELGNWHDGDEILVPALTFVATANVVLEHGLVPVFVDCKPDTYNIDPTKIEGRITKRTRAIMPVHLFGLIADMDPIMEIARKHNLRVIEDSCETIGVSYRGKKAGSFGDISCFSTYVAHFIVTGIGGLAITNDPQKAEILRSLANHGRDSIYMSIDDDKDLDGNTFREVIRRRFRFVRRGYSFRATEMEAAIGVGQLERFSDILHARQHNASRLSQILEPFSSWLQLPSWDSNVQEHGFMMYPIVIQQNAPFKKEELVHHIETWNVESRDMMPLINQPVYAFMNIKEEEYPVASWINRCGFYIGCHQGMQEEDLVYIGKVFREFFKKTSLL
jgi:dTDP-4-amino-4,6-dideoxygalactose transaminase